MNAAWWKETPKRSAALVKEGSRNNQQATVDLTYFEIAVQIEEDHNNTSSRLEVLSSVCQHGNYIFFMSSSFVLPQPDQIMNSGCCGNETRHNLCALTRPWLVWLLARLLFFFQFSYPSDKFMHKCAKIIDLTTDNWRNSFNIFNLYNLYIVTDKIDTVSIWNVHVIVTKYNIYLAEFYFYLKSPKCCLFF